MHVIAMCVRKGCTQRDPPSWRALLLFSHATAASFHNIQDANHLHPTVHRAELKPLSPHTCALDPRQSACSICDFIQFLVALIKQCNLFKNACTL